MIRTHRTRVIVIAAMLLVLGAGVALAHTAPSGWQYPTSCCHGQHCSPLSYKSVKPTPNGYYIIPTGETVPYDKANVSPDGQYHYCSVRSRHDHDAGTWKSLAPRDGLRASTSDDRYLNRSRICFFAPEGAV